MEGWRKGREREVKSGERWRQRERERREGESADEKRTAEGGEGEPGVS